MQAVYKTNRLLYNLEKALDAVREKYYSTDWKGRLTIEWELKVKSISEKRLFFFKWNIPFYLADVTEPCHRIWLLQPNQYSKSKIEQEAWELLQDIRSFELMSDELKYFYKAEYVSLSKDELELINKYYYD